MTLGTTRQIFENRLKSAGIKGKYVCADTLFSLGAKKGAYLLLIDIIKPYDVTISTLAETILETGQYIYIGNAYGPGGIQSRLKRHFATSKKTHWHIDHITTQAKDVTAYAVENGIECDLVKTLFESGRFHFPIKNFGSSDCKLCTSHLLAELQ
jgi:Uri superfamily endonuclease